MDQRFGQPVARRCEEPGSKGGSLANCGGHSEHLEEELEPLRSLGANNMGILVLRVGAFEDAFKAESSRKFFKAEVYSASADDGRIHAWIKITSLETGRSVYVDDGFWDGKHVHSKPPCGGAYKNVRSGCDVPRDQCRPPPAFDSSGTQSPPVPRGPVGPGPYIGPFNPWQ
jgi:hypothetical protein